MRKLTLLLLLPVFVLSCSNNEAEKAADQFHAKLDAGEYDYILDNLVDTEAITGGEWDNFFATVSSWGPQKNRKNLSNYNFNTRNGVTTVKLSYTFEVEGFELMHERLIMVDRDGSYKVLFVAINTDESVVIDATKEY